MLSMIGSRLKVIRKEKGVTLQELAEKTDLSIGLLSNVERNLRSPTIVNFHKICNALDITINEVLAPSEEKLCVRKDDREVVFSKENHDTRVTYSVITVGEKALKGMCMNVKDKGMHKSFKHTSDELGIIVSGQLQFEMAGETYILNEGDTIYVPAGNDHSFKKLNDGESASYWITATSKDLQDH